MKTLRDYILEHIDIAQLIDEGFYSVIVAAFSEGDAKTIHPRSEGYTVGVDYFTDGEFGLFRR